MKKLLLLLCLLLAVTLTAFAGGQRDKKGGAPTVTLDFWYPTWWDAEPRAYVLAEGFMEKYPYVKINGTPYGDPAILDNLYIASASKTGPDIYFLWLGYQQWPLVDAGFTLDLTNYNKQYQWDKKLKAAAIQSVSYKGKIWGVPFCLQSMVLFGRKDLIDKYNNGKTPESMADLHAFGDRLKAAGKYLAVTASLDGWHLLRFSSAFIENYVGVPRMDKLLMLEPGWDSPEVVQGLKEVKLWGDKYFQPGFQGIKPGDAKIAWYNGNAAIQHEGAWIEGTLKADGYLDKVEVVTFPFPMDSRPLRINSFPEQLAVTTRCKNPDEAVMLADWWASLEATNKYKDVVPWAPACLGYQYDPEMKIRIAVDELSKKYGAFPPWDGGLPMEFANVVYEVQDSVIAGTMTLAQGAKRLEAGMAEYRAKQK